MTERKPSDQELLQGVRRGDEEAFVALYRRWQAPLYRFALQMSGSRALAEDATQETFLALMRDLGSFDPARGSFGGWVYGIARHLVLRALEREGPRAGAEESEFAGLAEPAAPAASSPHEAVVRSQRSERLWRAILALPLHYREVVVLCELQEKNYAEAAELLGCSIGTVRSRLHRARSMLAERLRSAGFQAAKALGIEPDGCAI